MSYINKPSPKSALVAPLVRDGSPTCERDGFPLLKIGGRLQCVFEYLHKCVMHQPVADMVQRGQTFYYVFEDGHQLPLLCSCCGGSLAVDNLVEERQRMRGRYLDSLTIEPMKLPNGREIDELILVFSDQERQSLDLNVPVAFDVAAKLLHPANCPHKGISPMMGHPLKKKRLQKKRTRK